MAKQRIRISGSAGRSLGLSRREFLAASAGSLAWAARARASTATLRVVALGQSLIIDGAAARAHPGFAAIRSHLADADVQFSDLECVIRSGASASARGSTTAPIADPDVLDFLRRVPINLLATSNNHAFDLGAAGIASTLEETKAGGFVTAGSGPVLADAARAATLNTAHGPVALIAMASGALPATAFATATTAGVNHLAVRGDSIDAADEERVRGTIAGAAARGSFVIVYQHDHYWAPDWRDTPEWKKRWARGCIDAGASMFISHGVPLLHGVEIYKRRPIFYGLGNFIFQLAHIFGANIPAQYQDTDCWRSVIADCAFEANAVTSMSLTPICLRRLGTGGSGDELHGRPSIAAGAEAAAILARLRTVSAPLGTVIDIRGDAATVRL